MIKITRDILDDIIEGKNVTHYISPPKRKTGKTKNKKSNFNERMKQMGQKNVSIESSNHQKATYRQPKVKKSSYVNPNLRHEQKANKRKSNNSSKQKLNDIQQKLKQMQGK